MKILHYYRTPGFSTETVQSLVERVREKVSSKIENIETEVCFNVALARGLSPEDERTLRWLLSETFEPEQFGPRSFLRPDAESAILEVGPRLNFQTAWSTNAVAICHACGLRQIDRLEFSRRYRLIGSVSREREIQKKFLALIHDRMTEIPYLESLNSFRSGIRPEPVEEIPLLQEGKQALEKVNREAGLAFDDWDLDYYYDLFVNRMKRNPTNVECFDIAQSNSEHSRHWFFKGRLILDGEEQSKNLMELIRTPLDEHPNNSTIAFKDNSSAIRGYRVRTILPVEPGSVTPLREQEVNLDLIFTAETHNFPSGVAPFPGAETGTGGRIRDVHATGKGSLVVAGTAAYCVGNLHIPDYALPWEDPEFLYPSNLATPLEIEIAASNGASDYGNKFGEPVIQGYTRSYGLRLPDGERREWIKPIMFSGGIGQLDARHREKESPEVDMWVVKIGGPAYRIGLGGGAASSMVQGENVAELDFNAVQRGDAEMEQKVNRVIRACVEMGELNPIVSIHDQGAGGNCNVLKEIVEPQGARIEVREFPLGDETLSVVEIWVAEYQENDALLLRPKHRELFERLCDREKVPVAFVGRVTGDGRIVLYDEKTDSRPVDLDLEPILGDMPQKVFESRRRETPRRALKFPRDLTVRQALERVLRILSVGSKRFLTSKVDRCVTGLVARQPCAGPLQLTVSDVAVIAQSHFGVTGGATAIGEQPILGLLDPKAMARMSVGEALTNLVWARVSALEDVKCSGNWMWAAKLPGEGAALYAAAEALQEILLDLKIGIDGGKDSLSMAALAPTREGEEETVKAPGSLVISAYVTCPDVRQTVTPDLKLPDDGCLFLMEPSLGSKRLGGSALAYAFSQLGDEPPDVEDPQTLAGCFRAVQSMLEAGLIRAGHDRSDGGLITTLLEMAFAGNCGMDVQLPSDRPGSEIQETLKILFNEELGMVFEVAEEDRPRVEEILEREEIPAIQIGRTTAERRIRVEVEGECVIDDTTARLRDIWEETSYRIDRLQANPECIEEERRSLPLRTGPRFELSFDPIETPAAVMKREDKIKVAILREEGSNGDREMTSAFYAAGFEPWDVTMSDLLAGRTTLEGFRGAVFVGGFSYADVLDSGKGWAGVIRFNESLRLQFEEFYQRPDTFSLGICNGCQLMALLGWVPWTNLPTTAQPRFIGNRSGRFESRFSTVRIEESPSIMLRGMAGSVLGVWVAHGEGRAFFPDAEVEEEVERRNLVPLRYVDDKSRPSEIYPFNPNGSPRGTAGLCSPDGRHLVMMPHPERTFRKWQWGWMPESWKRDLLVSPWLRMFQNAREWCEQTEG